MKAAPPKAGWWECATAKEGAGRGQAAARLGDAGVRAGEEQEGGAAEGGVVEVRDDEVGVVQLPVDREDGEEDARDPAHEEGADHADREEQRGRVLDRAAPQG